MQVLIVNLFSESHADFHGFICGGLGHRSHLVNNLLHLFMVLLKNRYRFNATLMFISMHETLLHPLKVLIITLLKIIETIIERVMGVMVIMGLYWFEWTLSVTVSLSSYGFGSIRGMLSGGWDTKEYH